MFSFLDLDFALDGLADDEWIEWRRDPSVIEAAPQLFYSENREFISVTYSNSVVWSSNHEYTLDFRIDEALSAPWLETLDSLWFFPCHAIVAHPEVGDAASITGLITFEGWRDRMDYEPKESGLSYGDPLIAALSSSTGLRQERAVVALANAARLILGIEPTYSSELQIALDTKPEDR